MSQTAYYGNITTSASTWDASKLEGKYIYPVYYGEDKNTWNISSGNVYKVDWHHISDNDSWKADFLDGKNIYPITINNGWINLQTKVKAGDTYLPTTYTYDENEYVYYIMCAEEPSVTYCEQSNLTSGWTLLTASDLNEAHAIVPTIYLETKVTNNSDYQDSGNKEYNGNSYTYYACSNSELTVGQAYALSEDIKVILSSEIGTYINTAKTIVINGGAVTGGSDYTEPTLIDETHVSYVTTTEAKSYGARIVVGDASMELMTQADVNNYIIKGTTRYQCWSDDLWRTTAVNDTKEKLAHEQYYDLSDGDKLYVSGDKNYADIEDNETFFAANPSYLHTDTDTQTLTFTEILANAVAGGAYTDVVFEKDGADVVITPAISQAVLYQNKAQNPTVKTLDLGETTITTLADAFVGKDQYNNAIAQTVLTTLVLPSGNQSVVGTNDLKFTSLNALTTLDVSKANLSDDDAKKIHGYQDHNATVNIIEKDGYTVDQLVSRYGTDCNGKAGIYSRITTGSTTETDAYIYANTAKISDYMSGTSNVVVGGTVNITSGFLAEAEKCEGILNLVTAKMNGVETNAFADFTNTTIKRVILPDNTEISTLAKKATGAPIYQTFFTPGYTVNVAKANKVEIYTHAGALGEIKDAHYYSADINGATRQSYFGTINASDIAWLNGVNTRELDMTQVTHASESELTAIKAALHEFNNDNIVYVALPDLGALPVEPLYTDLRNNCENVKAVGQFDAATGGMNYYGVEPGCANVITDMLSDLTCNDQGTKNIKITRIKMSGVLNYKDIYGGGQTSACNATGHFWEEGDGAKDSSGALDGAQAVYADFSDAVFGEYTGEGFVEHSKDMTFAKAGAVYANCQELLLPTSSLMTTIPESCFENMQHMKSLAIPNVYKYIETNAFYLFGNQNEENMRIYTINVDANGDVVETIDNGSMTVTLPASLERIATCTFHMTWHPTDVFSLKAEAPICEKDAFDGPAYWGNNGFTNEYPITRESYYNQGAAIAILHFPNADSEAQKKKYTDLTRHYSLRGDLNTTDENGDVYLWPTQMEYGHSYLAASIGRLYGDTEYLGDGNNIYVGETEYKQTGLVPEAERTFGTDNDVNYIGWHQFVFTATTYTNQSNWDFSQFSDNYWWTICVPFDMTKKDVEEVFGSASDNTDDRGTWVCDFTGVKRVLNSEKTALKITLLFGTDNVAGADDDDVVIKAHRSYMIKPARSTGSKTPENMAGIYAFTTKADASTVGYKPIPTTVTALDGDSRICKYTYEETKEEVYYDYSFVGNYEPNKYVPMYSYFLGWDNSKNNVAFFREMAEGTASDKWNTFTSIIVPVHKQTTISHIENNMIVANEEINYDCQNDDYVILDNGNKVKAVNPIYELGYTNDDNEVTSIDDVHGIIPEYMKAGNVYNVNGQLVGNCVVGLSKGIYIRNGKKIIIK